MWKTTERWFPLVATKSTIEIRSTKRRSTCAARSEANHASCKATLTIEPSDLSVIETEKTEKGKKDKHFLKSDPASTEKMLNAAFWKVRDRTGNVSHSCTDPSWNEDEPQEDGLPPKKG